MPYHIIFEGAELGGKSWIMSQVYNELEPKYASRPDILDGCYWFNCDLGFFGTSAAPEIMANYLNIFRALKDKNILVEKFQLSAAVYGQASNQTLNQLEIEKTLKDMGFKIVLLVFPEDEKLLSRRLQDRLNLYPNYQRIAKTPAEYIKQQTLYKEVLSASSLDSLVVEIESFPNQAAVEKIKDWLKI